MPRPPKLLKDLIKANKNINVADVVAFIAHYSRLDESRLGAEMKRAQRMLQPERKKETLTPPAGLSAKQAVPIILAYVREEMGKPATLTKEERGSFSSAMTALDRLYGEGFSAKVISELNSIPNGSNSLHYPK